MINKNKKMNVKLGWADAFGGYMELVTTGHNWSPTGHSYINKKL